MLGSIGGQLGTIQLGARFGDLVLLPLNIIEATVGYTEAVRRVAYMETARSVAYTETTNTVMHTEVERVVSTTQIVRSVTWDG